MIQPVILCGGAGTRLWPLSTPDRPKPFIPFLGERTLFEHTLDRIADRSLFSPPVVVAGNAHVPLVEEQAGNVDLIVEPMARQTAPAIALAAMRLDPETVMLVCPSDHFIADTAAFVSGVERASDLAREGYLVSLGVEPTEPATGYGYIQSGEAVGPGHRVARFVEKPDAQRAAEFLAQGGFVWNAGIFVFTAGHFLEELERLQPTMHAAVVHSVKGGAADGHIFHPEATPFASIAGESIDYAVMEKTARAAVVAVDMGWSDIGSWDALAKALEAQDGRSPVDERAELIDCDGVMVRSDGPRVSAVGLEDVIIIVEGDEVLVLSRDAAQSVGRLKGAKTN